MADPDQIEIDATDDSDLTKNPIGCVPNSLKRSLPSPSNRDPRKLSKYTDFSIITQNRFDSLPQDVQGNSENNTNVKERKPPPIFLTNVINYEQLLVSLNTIAAGVEFKCKASMTGVTIYSSTPALYRQLVIFLKAKNLSFHTYQLFEDKSHRVVLRGLHHTTPVDLIKRELTEVGFEVRNVVNVLSQGKVPLPLFFVDLEPKSSQIEEIYQVKTILNTIVRVEELRRNKNVVQCTRCQQYNHTKAYCNREPRCVKCAGHHVTSECRKRVDTAAKCALCSLPHTANYKGCTVYQDLQKQRRKSQPTTSSVQPSTGKTTNVTEISGKKMFPSLSRNVQNNVNNNTNNNNNNNVSSMGNNSNSNERSTPTNFNYNSSYASALRGDHHSVGSPTNSLFDMFNNFLSEIKNLIMPLMNLMTQLTQVILTKNGP